MTQIDFRKKKTKQQLRDRWESILETAYERIPRREAYAQDKSHVRRSSMLWFLGTNYITVALLEYLLNNNHKLMHLYMQKAVPPLKQIYQEYDAGLPNIDASKVAMTDIDLLLSVLASGNIGLAKDFSAVLGGRREEERSIGDQFWEALGYPVKFILEGCFVKPSGENKHRVIQGTANYSRDMPFWPWVDILRRRCEKLHPNLVGLADILDGILDRNLDLIHAGFADLIKNHHKEAESGLFYSSENEDLLIWGIGLANLCRYKGLDVQIDHFLIPQDLLIPCSDSVE